jgi:hypothetical protein
MSNLIPIEPSHPVYKALFEIQKPRTRFQLEKFVSGQHDTEPQRYKQVLLEIQSLLYSIKMATLEIKQAELQVQRLRATGDEIDEIEAQKRELGIEQSQYVFVGAQRELKDLIEMWESFPHKYTNEEIEQDQEEYWAARLLRQAQLEAMGSEGKITWSALDALRQIGKLDIDEEIAYLEEQKLKEIK